MKTLKNTGLILMGLGTAFIINSWISGSPIVTPEEKAAQILSICMVFIGVGIESFAIYKEKKAKEKRKK